MKILMISISLSLNPGTPITALGYEIDLIAYHIGKDVEFQNAKIHRVRNAKMIQHVPFSRLSNCL